MKLAPVATSYHASLSWKAIIPTRHKTPLVSVYDYSPRNKNLFTSLMRKTDFMSIDTGIPLDELTELFLATIKSIHDFCFQLKDIYPKRTSDLPWITPAIKIVMKLRNNAYRNKSIPKFKHYRNKVKSMLLKSKVNYGNRVASLSTKANWKIIKELAGIKQSPPLSKFTADELNNFFASVFVKDSMEMKFDLENLPSSPITVSSHEVFLALRKIHKNPGTDGLPTWIFRESAEALCEIVAHILNIGFNTGKFPKVFKSATIVPVPKVKKPSSASEHRPISLLHPLAKLMERFAYDKWFRPNCTAETFSDQFAFVPVKGRGTTVALTLLMGRIYSFLDLPGTAHLLLVDFSKAFDLCTKSQVLNALASCNFPRECVTWVHNFLSDRIQRVRYNEVQSGWCDVGSGVPQGSLLGPILFAFLVSSIKPVTTNSLHVKFADDLSIITFFRHNQDNNNNTESELHAIEEWAADHGMLINATKTKLLCISTDKKHKCVPIVSKSGQIIERVDHSRLLGICISSKLSWARHVDEVVSKTSRRIFALIQLRRAGCSADILWRVYFSLIRSCLVYGYQSMTNMPSTLFRKLAKVERRAGLIIRSPPGTTLRDFCTQLCGTLIEDIKRDTDHPLRCLFECVSHAHCTRKKKTLNAPFARTARFKNSFIKFMT